jgi:hypothetical protein
MATMHAMKPRVANIVLLVSGLALTVLGITLIVMGRGASDAPGLVALPRTEAGMLEAGKALVEQYNCNFCHQTDVPEDHPLPRDNCQLCHQEYNRFEHLALPLERIGERRTEEFIRRYLRYPYPIRTQSAERMPDLMLSDIEVEVLTQYLLLIAADGIQKLPDWQPEYEENPDPERLSAAKALWDKYLCGTCHSFDDHKVVPEYGMGGVPLLMPAVFAAPLDEVYHRTRPQWLAPAIHDPAKWLPWSGMYPTTMSEEEARELAWYITNAAQRPEPEAGWHEVQGVLQRACSACHYGPSDDAGPESNPLGGAGWLGTWSNTERQLDLLTYENVMRGALDDLGNRRPSVVPHAPNSPLLMHIKGHKQPAMPFGADPLQPEEIALIRDWIMSGAKGP